MGIITLCKTPHLVEPYLIMGLDGYSNIERIPTKSILYLCDHFRARTIGAIMGHYYMDSSNSPQGRIREGHVKFSGLPAIMIHLEKNPEKSKNDLVFLSGYEPHDKWERCASDIVRLSEELGVRRLFTIGSYYSDVLPHTRRVPIQATFNNSRLRRVLEKKDVEFVPSCSGPLPFNDFLLAVAADNRLDAVGLWVGMPTYLRMLNRPIYSAGCCAVLKTLGNLLEIDFNTEDLEDEAFGEDKKVSEIINQFPDMIERLAGLEKAYDERRRPKEPVNKEIEEILKRVGF